MTLPLGHTAAYMRIVAAEVQRLKAEAAERAKVEPPRLSGRSVIRMVRP